METIVERPSLEDQQVAQASLPDFTRALAQKKSESISIQLPQSNSSVTIPAKAFQLLAGILASMAQGKAITLMPADAEISTQQAADLLNVSRPHLVKLLEQGTIPFKKAGSHRRILLDDLLAYQAHQKQRRDDQLAFLTEQAQALNLGYE